MGKSVKIATHTTRKSLHATKLARKAVKQGADAVVAVGGDGTIWEVVNGLAGSDIPLGIIPAGSGNDTPRSLKMEIDPDVAMKQIIRNRSRPVDIVKMNDHFFLNVMGIGLDAEVGHHTQKHRGIVKKAGPKGVYLHSVARVIPGFKPKKLRISIEDKKPKDHELGMVTIGNGTTCGGGFKLTPKAKMDDGKVDLSMVEWPGVPRAVKNIKRYYDGRHLEKSNVTYKQVTKLTIESLEGDVAYHIDGEPRFAEHFEIEVVPGGLNILH